MCVLNLRQRGSKYLSTIYSHEFSFLNPRANKANPLQYSITIGDKDSDISVRHFKTTSR